MSKTMQVLAVCALGAVTSSAVFAQADYPSKPIRLVVGFTAGGISDVLARAIGAKLSAGLGQQVVVDNRAGAGTTIASDIVAKSPPDGYTLFMQDITTHAINATLYKKLPYDTVKDFTPVSLVASSPLLLLVHPSLPVKTVKELIALAKSKPGQIVYASSGNGTILHLAAETLKSMAGIDMVHVPYKGSSQAVQGVLTGEVAVSFSTMPPALPQVKSGRLRAIGVTTPKRNAATPDVPTIDEAGLKGFDIVLYSGVLAPANTPAAIIDKLHAAIAKIIQSPETRERILGMGADPALSTPAEFSAFIAAELKKWTKVIKDSGAKLD